MAPKKNPSKPAVVHKTPKERVLKPKFKKEKPKLKTPSIVKVKISHQGKKLSPANTTSLSATETLPALNGATIKKMLMLDRINEVARAQLVKDSPVRDESVPEKKVVKKKLGRPRKVMENEASAKVASGMDTSVTSKNVPVNSMLKKKKARQKKVTEEEASAKADSEMDTSVICESVPENSAVKKKKARPKKVTEEAASAKADSEMDTSVTCETVPENSAVKKKKARPKKVTQEAKIANDVKGIPKKKAKTPQVKPESAKKYKKPKAAVPKKNPSPKTTKPVLKRKKPQGGSRIVKRATRGNPMIESESATTSPSILSQALMSAETPANETQKPLKSPVKTVTENTDSRRTSVTSASEWSWTKDISGSSTTTCVTVCSTDFVRFDGKLPVVKLAKVEALPEKKEAEQDLEDALSDTSSSTSSSSSSSSESSHQSNTVNTFLNLSTSSVSATKSRSPTFTPVDNSAEVNKDSSVDRFTATLEKLSAKLKSFDPSLMSCSEYDDVDPINLQSFEEKMHKIMEEEYNALLECNFLSQILSDKCSVTNKVIEEPVTVGTEEETFAKPAQNAVPKVTDVRNDASNEYPRRRDSMSFEPNDDDDALSLYAESITGFESSRVSSAASVACEPPAHEEYIPQPIRRDTWAPIERNYQPSKISDQRSKIVCEKQNADSTSINREPEAIRASNAMPNTVPSSLVTFQTGQKRLDTAGNQRLTISDFDPPPGIKLTLLKGVCFFNMISNCMRVNCTFPHRQVEVEEVSMALKKLGEKQFIMEYMMFSRWPTLRLKFTKCFILECQRRELPKILVEMVIDFINKTSKKSKEEMAVKVDIIESALLYLNGINLTVCEDLLQYRFNNNKYLCEVFMETIANTQNFSRFKLVFMNLSSFMVRANMTFSFEVACHILERVCIYPFEAPLAMVLLSIIEKTNKKIFDNNMMNMFEKILSASSKPMHERLLELKGRAEEPPSPAPVVSPVLCPGLEPLSSSLIQSDSENTYTSPDTTNLDNLNKPPVEPIITRTVNLDKIRSLNTSNSSVGSGPHHFKNRWSEWNQKSIYDKIPRFMGSQPRFMSSVNRPRTPLKRPMGGHVQYGPRQFKFPRVGPDYGKK